MKLLALIFISVTTIFSSWLWAQDKPIGQDGWFAGAAVGPFLPSNLPPMTNIMKAAQARVSWFEGVLGWELTGFGAAEDGAKVIYVLGSLTRAMPLPDSEDILVLVSVGVQLVYYRGVNAQGEPLSTAQSGGVHMAGGFKCSFTPRMAGRAGFAILNGPGRALMVDVGLEWSFGEEKSKPP